MDFLKNLRSRFSSQEDSDDSGGAQVASKAVETATAPSHKNPTSINGDNGLNNKSRCLEETTAECGGAGDLIDVAFPDGNFVASVPDSQAAFKKDGGSFDVASLGDSSNRDGGSFDVASLGDSSNRDGQYRTEESKQRTSKPGSTARKMASATSMSTSRVLCETTNYASPRDAAASSLSTVFVSPPPSKLSRHKQPSSHKKKPSAPKPSFKRKSSIIMKDFGKEGQEEDEEDEDVFVISTPASATTAMKRTTAITAATNAPRKKVLPTRKMAASKRNSSKVPALKGTAEILEELESSDSEDEAATSHKIARKKSIGTTTKEKTPTTKKVPTSTKVTPGAAKKKPPPPTANKVTTSTSVTPCTAKKKPPPPSSTEPAPPTTTIPQGPIIDLLPTKKVQFDRWLDSLANEVGTSFYDIVEKYRAEGETDHTVVTPVYLANLAFDERGKYAKALHNMGRREYILAQDFVTDVNLLRMCTSCLNVLLKLFAKDDMRTVSYFLAMITSDMEAEFIKCKNLPLPQFSANDDEEEGSGDEDDGDGGSSEDESGSGTDDGGGGGEDTQPKSNVSYEAITDTARDHDSDHDSDDSDVSISSDAIEIRAPIFLTE